MSAEPTLTELLESAARGYDVIAKAAWRTGMIRDSEDAGQIAQRLRSAAERLRNEMRDVEKQYEECRHSGDERRETIAFFRLMSLHKVNGGTSSAATGKETTE